MYIGPWQEYNLSKSRQVEASSNYVESENFRKELIGLLERNLDPANALKTIKAINPLLEKAKEGIALPVIRLKERRLKPRILSQLKIDSIDNSLPSLSSHRSSKSEPVKSPRLMYTPNKNPNTGRSDYDPTMMITILKQERESRKNETKVHSDVSNYWKWKANNSSIESHLCNTESAGSVKHYKLNNVDKVKKMKMLYTSAIGGGGDVTKNSSIHVQTEAFSSARFGNLSVSPIRLHSPNEIAKANPYPPPHPNLAEAGGDISAVAKYFNPKTPEKNNLSKSANMRRKINIESVPLYSKNVPDRDRSGKSGKDKDGESDILKIRHDSTNIQLAPVAIALSPVRDTSLQRRIEIQAERDGTSNVVDTASGGKPLPSALSPLMALKKDDELFDFDEILLAGGYDESLINWSSNLNVDGVDDMY